MSALLRRVVCFRTSGQKLVVGKLLSCNESSGRVEVLTPLGIRSYPLADIPGVIQEVRASDDLQALEREMALQERKSA